MTAVRPSCTSRSRSLIPPQPHHLRRVAVVVVASRLMAMRFVAMRRAAPAKKTTVAAEGDRAGMT